MELLQDPARKCYRALDLFYCYWHIPRVAEGIAQSECGDCPSTKGTCSGCQGRACEETGDTTAADLACWLAPVVAKERKKQYRMVAQT